MISLRTLSSFGITIFLLAQIAQCNPLPQPQGVVVNGFAQSDAKTICNISYDNQILAWENSGASHFLDTFITQNGEPGWANAVDQKTSVFGSVHTSSLNCIDLGPGGSCPPPDISLCPQFTPPALWHIRYAMTTAYQTFGSIQAHLLKDTFIVSLNVDQIVQDFGPSPASSNAGIFGAISGAFSIGAGLAAATPEVTGPLGVISGIFGILGATADPGGASDPTAAINVQLANLFSTTNDLIINTTKTIFGGPGFSSDKLPGVTSAPGPNGEKTNIAKFFANGKFLVPITDKGGVDDKLAPVFQQSLIALKQFVVIATLKASNYYIFVNTDRSQSDCNAITGSAFISNQCFTIEKNAGPATFTQPIVKTTAPLDSGTASKLTDPNSNYNFDLPTLYKNANACQSAHPNFDGTIDTGALPLDGSIPTCFFNLPVIKAAMSPCVLVLSGGNVPANLGFSRDTCTSQGRRPS